MKRHDFHRIVDEALAPFLTDLGFTVDSPLTSGRHYEASFTSVGHCVSVSFEPGENECLIRVFTRKSGELSDIDDPIATRSLGNLVSRHLYKASSAERAANEEALRSIVAQDEEEKLLLKSVKDLRLVLPRYLEIQKRLA